MQFSEGLSQALQKTYHKFKFVLKFKLCWLELRGIPLFGLNFQILGSLSGKLFQLVLRASKANKDFSLPIDFQVFQFCFIFAKISFRQSFAKTVQDFAQLI